MACNCVGGTCTGSCAQEGWSCATNAQCGNLDGGGGPGQQPPGPPTCFQEGTKIETSEGIKSIEDIKVGDIVKSYDTKNSEIVESKVYETFEHKDNSDGLLLNGIIKTTTNHPFYSDGNWIEAGKLKPGDKILHVDGEYHIITSVETLNYSVDVYNFEVEETHNYFAEGYLVHNKWVENKPRNIPPAPKSSGFNKIPFKNSVSRQQRYWNRGYGETPDPIFRSGGHAGTDCCGGCPSGHYCKSYYGTRPCECIPYVRTNRSNNRPRRSVPRRRGGPTRGNQTLGSGLPGASCTSDIQCIKGRCVKAHWADEFGTCVGHGGGTRAQGGPARMRGDLNPHSCGCNITGMNDYQGWYGSCSSGCSNSGASCSSSSDCNSSNMGLVWCACLLAMVTIASCVAAGCWYGSCFVAGTRVRMADGTEKDIEDIVVGDKLLGDNNSTNTVEELDWVKLGDRKLYSLNDDDNYFVTSDHPFKTTEGWRSINPYATRERDGEWLFNELSGNLDTGNTLVTENGDVKLKSIDSKEIDNPDLQLYNFHLDGDHSYYANGYLVHNKGGNARKGEEEQEARLIPEVTKRRGGYICPDGYTDIDEFGNNTC